MKHMKILLLTTFRIERDKNKTVVLFWSSLYSREKPFAEITFQEVNTFIVKNEICKS